jgi:DNA polymerase-1
MSGEFQTINKAQADLWFYTQALTGDVTDGYAGCPSVGPKTAEKLLKQDPSWTTVVNAYAKQKLNKNYALTQARLARILRYEDWDLDSNTIKLWEPRYDTNAKKT